MWFYPALLMSFISGIYVVVSKHTLKKMDPVIFFWITITASTPLVIIFAWQNGIPVFDNIFLLGILGSVFFYTISKIIFWKTIKDSTLSDVYPLMSIGPVFTLILSIIILSEKLTLLTFLGCIITLLGTYILNVSSAREGLLQPFKILFQNKLALLMMVSVLIGSVVTIFDKIAIIHTFPQNLFFPIIAENILISIGLLPWIIYKRKVAITEIKENKKVILLLGIIFPVSTILGFYSLSLGNPGLVSSVFRTQIFFVFLLSFIFFKDKPRLETIVGSFVMILGLVLTKLFS